MGDTNFKPISMKRLVATVGLAAFGAAGLQAQTTPGLNVKSGKLDRMRLEYFSDALVDGTVRTLLAPYVALKGS